MPLIKAIEAGDVSAVGALLEGGADPNVLSEWGDPALVVAVSEGNLPIVDSLIKAGADATALDEEGASVLHAGPRHPELLELLIEAGAPVNQQDDDGLTALYLLVSEPALVEILLDHGADPNVETKDHETPLSFCAAWGHAGSARLLLEAGADVNHVDGETGLSVLCYAAESGQTEMVELLLDYGADPDYRSPRGRSPLSWALEHQHVDVAMALAERSSAETRLAVSDLSANLRNKLDRLMRSLNR